jgi:thiamine-monophosphate kinase
MGEFERIRALIAGLPRGEGVIVGPGDDAAVLRLNEARDLVVTTDTFVEGRHFRRELLSPSEAGARFAAANRSDLAAMAAAPRWATMSLVLPSSWSAAAAAAFEHACAHALAAEGAAIVGGNLAAGDVFSATLTLMGEVARDAAWTRAGARAGDVLAVTGVPGGAAAFVAIALWGSPPSREQVPVALVERFISPPSRVPFARALAASGAVRAAIDVSDGLTADLAHLAEASGLGAALDGDALPADDALRAAARLLSAYAGQERGVLPAAEAGLLAHLQTGPSDDYELLMAIDPEHWPEAQAIAIASAVSLTRIGHFTAEQGLSITCGGVSVPLVARGWDHFGRDA